MAAKVHGERVRIDTLTADPRNAKKHDARSIEAISMSLREFGQVKPIVVDASGVVLAGNGTLAAAQALGWETIWLVRTELTGDAARAYAIADNRTAELAEWDFDELHKQLAEIEASSKSLLDVAWFDPSEAVRAFQAAGSPNSVEAEYQGMPEYTAADESGWKRLIVTFKSRDDYYAFAKLIDQKLTDQTRSIWHPFVEHVDNSTTRYVDES